MVTMRLGNFSYLSVRPISFLLLFNIQAFYDLFSVRYVMCRSCTDVICLILFFIFVAAFVVVGVWGK